MAHSYGMFWGSPTNLLEFTGFFRERFDVLTRYARGPNRVGLAGADVSEPEEHLPVLVKEFNAAKDAPFAVRFAVPTDFETIAEKRGNRPVVTGEMNPVFQGIYSSRIEVKQRTRMLETLLTAAEKLSSLVAGLGLVTNPPDLDDAWEPVLFNQAHDLASGVMVDKVFEDSIRGFDYSRQRADAVIDDQFDRLLAKIDTRGDGTPIVVFNPLGWSRSDVVETSVSFSERGVTDLNLLGADGKPFPFRFWRPSATAMAASRPLAWLSSLAICPHWDTQFITSLSSGGSRLLGRFPQRRAAWPATPLRIKTFSPSRTSSIAPRSISGPEK